MDYADEKFSLENILKLKKERERRKRLGKHDRLAEKHFKKVNRLMLSS